MRVQNTNKETPDDRLARPARIAIADDDAELRRLLASSLAQDGHRVEEAATGFELLARLDRPSGQEVDLITGLELLAGLRSTDRPEGWDTPIILITAFGHDETYENKPFDVDDLRTCVLNVLARTRNETARGGEEMLKWRPTDPR